METTCPFINLFDAVSRRWSMLIISLLGFRGERRFNDLKKELGNITPRALSMALKILQENSLVLRKRLGGLPPGVSYSLSERGKGLLEVISPVVAWTAKETDHTKCELLPFLFSSVEISNHPQN